MVEIYFRAGITGGSYLAQQLVPCVSVLELIADAHLRIEPGTETREHLQKLLTEEFKQQATRFHLSQLYGDLPRLDELEKRYLSHVLEKTRGNRTRTAEILGIDRRTLYRMAERFGIELD